LFAGLIAAAAIMPEAMRSGKPPAMIAFFR
jgi:hypothetical protein